VVRDARRHLHAGGPGQQPLHEAKTVAIAEFLLDRGAGVDVRCIDHQSTPAQYALVGLALATFFLLLLALSEHIAFWIAYLIAAMACILLLAYYLSGVLAGLRRGLSFATMLTALYSALYGLLVSEDNALLLGSLLVFAVIATAMVFTRKVDWYRVGANGPTLRARESVAD